MTPLELANADIDAIQQRTGRMLFADEIALIQDFWVTGIAEGYVRPAAEVFRGAAA